MNKAVHALVYLVLLLAGVALFFEMKLFDKKELLRDRNQQLEESLITLSRYVEKASPAKVANAPQVEKDVSPVEAKRVDTPQVENLLEDYAAQLEEANLETLKWDDRERIQLRQIYLLDGDGNRQSDPAHPGDFIKKGKGTAQELIDQLSDRAKAQQEALNKTRAELKSMRERLQDVVKEYNDLKGPAREDKVIIEEQKSQIEEIETAKKTIEDQLAKTKSQVEDLNSEVKTLKDDVAAAKDEVENEKEEREKAEKKVEQLKALLRTQQTQPTTANPNAGASAVTSLPAGDKGSIIYVDTKLMFVLVKFNDTAMTELFGPERNGVLPALEMGLRRAHAEKKGAGDYVGRIRLRQSVAGQNYVIADIMGDWQQLAPEKGDIVFAE